MWGMEGGPSAVMRLHRGKEVTARRDPLHTPHLSMCGMWDVGYGGGCFGCDEVTSWQGGDGAKGPPPYPTSEHVWDVGCGVWRGSFGCDEVTSWQGGDGAKGPP